MKPKIIEETRNRLLIVVPVALPRNEVTPHRGGTTVIADRRTKRNRTRSQQKRRAIADASE